MVKLFAVTPDDVKRVANQYFTANRVRLDIRPGPQTPRPAEVEVERNSQAPLESPKVAEGKDDFDRSVVPQGGADPGRAPARRGARATRIAGRPWRARGGRRSRTISTAR